MRVAHSADYHVALPEGHRFPMRKYPALFRQLHREGLLRTRDVHEPAEVDWQDLRRVHTDAYLSDLDAGSLSRRQERRLGLPWSRALVRRSRRVVQATLDMARAALEDGCAANLAGGTHHAFAGHGEGFCVLNDVAVAVAALRAEGALRRALVCDLDVHQGNGTAELLAGDAGAFTFSVHCEANYPLVKARSTRDVALPAGTGDAAYLEAVARHLPEVIEEARPDLVFYLAGVDVFAGDRLGRLRLSRAGIAARERLVLRTLRARGLPFVILPAGGYAETPELTADLHAIVHREARALERSAGPRRAAPSGGTTHPG